MMWLLLACQAVDVAKLVPMRTVPLGTAVIE